MGLEETEKGEQFVLDPPSPPPQRSLTPFERAWRRTSPGGRLLYFIYIIPFAAIMVAISILTAFPYMFFRKTRPLLPKGWKTDPEFTLHSRYPPTDPRSISPYEWYGKEEEFPRGTALTPIGNGPGLHRRTWEMYGTFREVWQMALKQGLQLFGALSAVILLFMQVQMMLHDYKSDVVTKYTDAVTGGKSDPNEPFRSDKNCAYAVGTGMANWASGQEPLGALCLCLLGDELLNIRFGCFAPQWFRAGIGYTIIFLVAATLSTSPNWGTNTSLQFRYFVLVAIFLLGIYNVLRTLLSSVGLSSDGYKATDTRAGRKPLRLWTESEWQDQYYRQNFIPHDYDRYFWTESLQARLGDWNFPLQRRSRENIEAQMKILEELYPGYDDGRIEKVYQREPEEYVLQRGKVGRTVIHGGPKKMPYFMKNDLEKRKRLHMGPIDPKNPPTDEEEEEMIKMLNLDKGYFGIANWKPVTKSFGWWWFDIRRIYYMVCATALFFLRIGLCFFDLSSENLAAYRTEYEELSTKWLENGGPASDQCQYYQGSSVPIFIQASGGSFSGVSASMFWVATWHTMLLGMCFAIFWVAISNNMWWGMHVPFPCITLIGPRMTSMSMGITLGFVAIATLQQGFFFHNDSLITLTRIICYASVAGFILCLYPNEPLRANYTRDPFWPWSSRVAFRFLDRKKWHYDFKDAEDAQG
ncbi:hypothetical protein I316_07697 [Kwoniella heveanensis BCC8398]|uniref:Uncharacterized protein n=1 Tax=Kwoniella heveanensis BCC8398 TaxID=1296120 RepID=A0A1B9GHX0_9TREE|nr:hypothetical protein I316_07697 [Kwoniella heveanensis BCC8398]